jgi:Skp family chaperone for outer membrane proteins
MNGTPRTYLLLGGAMCVAMGAMLGLSAAARSAPEPTKVAVINLARLQESLEITQIHNREVDDIGKGFEADYEAIKTQIKDKEAERNSGQVLTPQQDWTLQKDIFELQEMMKARLQASQMLIQFEDGRRFLQRYRLMLDTTARVAEELGYDLVLMRSDVAALGPLPAAPTEPAEFMKLFAQMNEQILVRRRMFYVNESIDITDQVIARMGIEFNQGG